MRTISCFAATAILLAPLSVAGQDRTAQVSDGSDVPTGPYIEMPAPASSATPSAAAAAPRLTLEECIDIALSQSQTVKVADLEVKKVEYAKRETVGGLLPTIDFQMAYQRSIELQTVRMDLGGASQSFKMGSDNTWNMGFTAQLPIIAPTLWKAIHISSTQILSNLEAARSSRLELIDQVNRAYYALLLSLASRDVIAQSYDNAVFTADLYQKQFDQGTASEYDVLRSSVQVRTLEPQVLEADIAIKQCYLQLKVLMGVDSEMEFSPAVTLQDLEQGMYARTATDPSIDGNSSLRSLDIATRMARQNVDLKKFAYIPTLGVSYNLNWMSLSNGSPFRNQTFDPYSSVGLALNVPIFSGGARLYQVKQAQVQVKELELQREQLVNSLRMQTEVALDNINMEVRQIASSREGVRQADKAYEIVQKSFEIGAASYLELRDGDLARTSANLSYFQAIYNYLCSSSQLDLLLGREAELTH